MKIKASKIFFLLYDRLVYQYQELGAHVEQIDVVCGLLLSLGSQYSTIVTTLESLHPQCSSSETLKLRLASDPVLRIYDEKAETELHTDASKYGYGAAPLQKSDDDQFDPIAYMSQHTSGAERNYRAFHLETLAVICAVEKF